MYLIYQGPSMIDGQPIIALATCLDNPSINKKTGPMVQTYILSDVESPIEAVKSGKDASICGDCPHRAGSCYVMIHQAPQILYRRYRLGYFRETENLDELCRHRVVRLGAYGDPAAVPIAVWQSLLSKARGWTGYTHSPHVQPELKTLCQASVETEEHVVFWNAQGWKTYRTKLPDQELLESEVYCPAGQGVQCHDCRLCNGRKKNVAINVHGAQHKVVRFTRYLKSEG